MEVTCAKCGNEPDEIIVLSCHHNLCVSCGSKNLTRENSKQIHQFYTIVCDICSNSTIIEPESAAALLSNV